MSVLYFPGGREEEARWYTDAAARLIRSGQLTPGAAFDPKPSGRQARDRLRAAFPALAIEADGPHRLRVEWPGNDAAYVAEVDEVTAVSGWLPKWRDGALYLRRPRVLA